MKGDKKNENEKLLSVGVSAMEATTSKSELLIK